MLGWSGLRDGNEPFGGDLFDALLGRRNGQNAVRRQRGDDVVDVVVGGQHVPPNEVPGDVAVLVLLLFVLALDDDAVVRGLDRHLVGRELLDVEDHLELLLVGGDGRS